MHHLTQPGCIFLSYIGWWSSYYCSLWFNRPPSFDNDSEQLQIFVLLPRQIQEAILFFRGGLERINRCCRRLLVVWFTFTHTDVLGFDFTLFLPCHGSNVQFCEKNVCLETLTCLYIPSGNCDFRGGHHLRCSQLVDHP